MKVLRYVLALCLLFLIYVNAAGTNLPVSKAFAENSAKIESVPHVAVIDMQMIILPGTANFLQSSIEHAVATGAKALIVNLDTPGGILTTTQEMIQTIFKAPIPILIYVSPQAATATSAGVFIVLAGHVAAMAPGSSLGAAHPVQGDGQDIQGDMRQKAENMTIALVKSVAERRGRNVVWAEKSVRESSSLTDQEALKEGVIDLIATNHFELLKGISNKKIKLLEADVELGDYSSLPLIKYEMSYQDRFLNVLANPNVAALLWLAATTGLSIELYNPGLILPGVVGVICLVLALIVGQIIPLSQGAIALMIVGAVMIAAELVTGSLVLGFGGLVAIILGALYIVDTTQAPELAVSVSFILPIALVMSGFLLFVARSAYKVFGGKKVAFKGQLGDASLIGYKGVVIEHVSSESGKVSVAGEIWNARCFGAEMTPNQVVKVAALLEGMILEVKNFEENEK